MKDFPWRILANIWGRITERFWPECGAFVGWGSERCRKCGTEL